MNLTKPVSPTQSLDPATFATGTSVGKAVLQRRSQSDCRVSKYSHSSPKLWPPIVVSSLFLGDSIVWDTKLRLSVQMLHSVAADLEVLS